MMLFELLPIIIFFIVYKFYGIYTATFAIMLSSVLLVLYKFYRTKKIDYLQLLTLVIVLFLGAITIIFHNPLFIKWKPTVIYWLFAITFLIFCFRKKTLIEIMLDNKINLSREVWQNLYFMWICFFIFLGIANIFVAYNFSTQFWVNFKLFGLMSLSLIFVILQASYINIIIKKN